MKCWGRLTHMLRILRQQPAWGWKASLQDPTACFVDQSAPRPYHVHHPHPLFRHRPRQYLREAVSLPPIHDNPRYVFYGDLVMKGFITWGLHLMIVAIRHNVGVAPCVVCPFCGATPSMRHYVEQCRMAPLLRVFFHARLLLTLQDFCPRWRVSAVTGHEICILHGHDLFGIRLGFDPFHVPVAYPCATIELTGEISPPGRGSPPCSRDHPHCFAACNVLRFE